MIIKLKLVKSWNTPVPVIVGIPDEPKPDTSELEKLFNLKIASELRIFNSLKRNGIYTIEVLKTALDTGEIHKARNIGVKSIAFLNEALSKYEQGDKDHD